MIINKTPHVINVGNKVFQPEGEPFRLQQTTESAGELEGIPLTQTKYGGSSLPPYREDTYYIVSSLFCQAFPDRKDLLMVGETIRNEKGMIVGAKSLCRNPFNPASDALAGGCKNEVSK